MITTPSPTAGLCLHALALHGELLYIAFAGDIPMNIPSGTFIN